MAIQIYGNDMNENLEQLPEEASYNVSVLYNRTFLSKAELVKFIETHNAHVYEVDKDNTDYLLSQQKNNYLAWGPITFEIRAENKSNYDLPQSFETNDNKVVEEKKLTETWEKDMKGRKKKENLLDDTEDYIHLEI